MYRKLVLALVGALLAGALVRAYLVSGPVQTDGGHLQAFIGWFQARGFLRVESELGLVILALLRNLLAVGIGLLLVWTGAFNPARRPALPVTTARYLALLAAIAYSLYFLLESVDVTGASAATVSRQTGSSALLVMLGALPQRLAEAGALMLVLTGPLFAVVRSFQVASLRQASFEAWVEVRRHLRPALLLLAGAALLEAYLTPVVTASLLR